MKITCENCKTRFVLKAIRLPPQGARVRCSRCHHRFHVKPDPKPPTPDQIVREVVEDSAPPEGVGETAVPDAASEAAEPLPEPAPAAPKVAPAASKPKPAASKPKPAAPKAAPAASKPKPAAPKPAPAAPKAEPAASKAKPIAPEAEPAEAKAVPDSLDDPEFIFEKPAPPPPPLYDEDDEAPPSKPVLAAVPKPGPDAAGPVQPAGEARAVGAASASAPESESSAAREEIGSAGDTASSISRDALFGEAPKAGFDSDPDLGPPLEADPTPAQEPAPPVPAPEPAPEVQADAAQAEDWSDLDETESEENWQSFAQEDLSVERGAAARHRPAPAPVTLSEPRARQPVLAGWGAFAARAAAVAVGLLLVGGGVRALPALAPGALYGPRAIHWNGWVASEIEAFHARDADGRRVLVVLGALAPNGSDAAAPRVRAQLLDTRGRDLGQGYWAHPRRFAEADLRPDALSRHLRAPIAIRSPGRPSEGFTFLIADPPAGAERFRLEFVGP